MGLIGTQRSIEQLVTEITLKIHSKYTQNTKKIHSKKYKKIHSKYTQIDLT